MQCSVYYYFHHAAEQLFTYTLMNKLKPRPLTSSNREVKNKIKAVNSFNNVKEERERECIIQK